MKGVASMVSLFSLFVFFVGIILLYKGVRQAGSILLPIDGHEFLGTTGGDIVYLEKPGKYELCISTKVWSFFRRAAYQAKVEIEGVEGQPNIFYCPTRFALHIRTDRKGKTAIPLGVFKVYKPGNYRVRVENPEVFKKADILLIKRYNGNLRVALMILMLIAGAFLSIGGIIFFMDSLRGRI